MEIEPEQTLGIFGAVVSVGAVSALIGVVLFFPVIDRWIRPRFDLSRGAAMLLLLGMSLIAGIAGGAVSYALLHDHPDFQPIEDGPPAPDETPAGS